MAHAPTLYRGFRYPAEVIQHAVWLYQCFSLSLRDVETILGHGNDPGQNVIQGGVVSASQAEATVNQLPSARL